MVENIKRNNPYKDKGDIRSRSKRPLQYNSDVIKKLGSEMASYSKRLKTTPEKGSDIGVTIRNSVRNNHKTLFDQIMSSSDLNDTSIDAFETHYVQLNFGSVFVGRHLNLVSDYDLIKIIINGLPSPKIDNLNKLADFYEKEGLLGTYDLKNVEYLNLITSGESNITKEILVIVEYVSTMRKSLMEASNELASLLTIAQSSKVISSDMSGFCINLNVL